MITKMITLSDRRVNATSIKIGNEGDNNAERIKFVLPARLASASVFLFLSIDNHSDVVKLDEDRVFTPERKHTQYPGKWRAYLQATANGDVVWNSDEFSLYIGDLPPSGEQISQQYPTAIEEALRAVDTLTGVQARAETLPPGSEATVGFEADAEGNRTIVYGIPRGGLMYATFDIDPTTGMLTMITPEGYDGPTFALRDDGHLEVVVNG